jgi:malate synthase
VSPQVKCLAPLAPGYGERVLTPEALSFLEELEQRFGPRRQELLAARAKRQAEIRAGKLPDFLAETAAIRAGHWQVAPTPPDLQDRRVEITGPAEAKMMINALNSGARAFMCDLEDSLSPTWANVIEGQIHLQDAVRKKLRFKSDAGKEYRLNDKIATLLVRPRGWHLPEKHLTLNGAPLSGSLVDFGLYFFHNAKERLARGTGPYFYLPKMESHLEARLWADVFRYSEAHLGIPPGSTKVTVLIETILAAFEMDEILYELKDFITGLNAGRWDYIFSIIKKFSHDATRILPDRAQVTMNVGFMRAYCELLVETCHKRNAHAMGGMAAFIPSRKDQEVNRVAMAKVKEDKEREAKAGFDGTWIAHPDLVEIATACFDAVLGDKPHQKDKRPGAHVTAAQLIDLTIPDGKITDAGVELNIDVALQYTQHWLKGLGAVALHNLMEDAATAEISRAQLWQWVHQGPSSPTKYQEAKAKVLKALGSDYADAVAILDRLVLDEEFAEFLTLPAYEKL